MAQWSLEGWLKTIQENPVTHQWQAEAVAAAEALLAAEFKSTEFEVVPPAIPQLLENIRVISLLIAAADYFETVRSFTTSNPGSRKRRLAIKNMDEQYDVFETFWSLVTENERHSILPEITQSISCQETEALEFLQDLIAFWQAMQLVQISPSLTTPFTRSQVEYVSKLLNQLGDPDSHPQLETKFGSIKDKTTRVRLQSLYWILQQGGYLPLVFLPSVQELYQQISQEIATDAEAGSQS